MPVYTYKCGACGKLDDSYRQIADRDTPGTCPVCNGETQRDVIASMTVHSTDQGYHTPILSNALGIHPDQIPDAQRRFPHHEFAPDGRMILRSHAQRNRVLKDLGFHDRDGYN